MENEQKMREHLRDRTIKVSEHVSDLWFPVNPELLGRIRSTINSEEEFNCAWLLSEVKQDVALFTYCLRELCLMLKQDGLEIQNDQFSDLTKLFELAGPQRLRAIIDVDANAISRHSLHIIDSTQLSRFQETMISAASSELLAQHYAINSDLAYTAAVLRQLGYCLIAWNYPAVYQGAMADHANGENLDQAIVKRLGISPTMLAYSLSRTWDLPKEIHANLFEQDPLVQDEMNEFEATSVMAETLCKICRAGEALARANNPQAYPKARDDWDFAQKEIEQVLGRDGIAKIKERVQDYSQHYLEIMPNELQQAFAFDPVKRLLEHVANLSLVRNPFVAQCRSFLEKRLLDLYQTLEGKRGASEHLRLLAKELFPLAGFARGCVYSLEPSNMTLAAQLAIGSAKLQDFPSPLYTSLQENEQLVVRAFRSGEVIIDQSAIDSTIAQVVFAGALGQTQRAGVVYAEISGVVFASEQDQHVLHFKALLQAFNDCLLLR